MEQKAVESGAVQDNDIGTEVSAQASTLLARTTLDYAYDSTDDEDVAEYRSYGHDENKLDVNADADGESISKDRTGQDIVAAHALVPSSESEANGNAAVADAQGKATEDDVDREHCMVVRTKRRSPPSAPRSHFLASRKISEDRRQVLSQHMAMDLKMKQQRMDFQKKLLHSYREDLSYWITEMCGEEISNQSEPFFEAIADGVILCRVAHAVCDAENSYITDNVGDANPTLWAPPKFNPRAKKGTFVARDNIHAFIMWSRQFGVPESALFETEDLVAAKELKNVLYTLMDVARLSHLSAERLPQLIQLEREIDSEIIAEHDEDDLANYPPPARVKPPLPPKPVGLKLLLAPQEPAEDEADRRPSLSSVTEEAEKEDGEVLADMIDLTESVLCEESSDVADEELISTAPSPEPEAAAEEEREEGADEEEEEEECEIVEDEGLLVATADKACPEDFEAHDVPEAIEVRSVPALTRMLSSETMTVPDMVRMPSPECVEPEVTIVRMQPVEPEVVVQTTSIQCDLPTTIAVQCGLGDIEPAPAPEIEPAEVGGAAEAADALKVDCGCGPSVTPDAQPAVTPVELAPEIDAAMAVDNTESPPPDEAPPVLNSPPKEKVTFVKGDEIDEAVQIMSSQYGGKVKLKRVRKGKYEVSHLRKNLFIRILRNHIMVRVGGGWDTLEHYLLTHQPEAQHLSTALLGAGVGTDHLATASALRTEALERKKSAGIRGATGRRASVFTPASSKQDTTGQVKVASASRGMARESIPQVPRLKKGLSREDLISPFRRSSSAQMLFNREQPDTARSPASSGPNTPAKLSRGGSRTLLSQTLTARRMRSTETTPVPLASCDYDWDPNDPRPKPARSSYDANDFESTTGNILMAASTSIPNDDYGILDAIVDVAVNRPRSRSMSPSCLSGSESAPGSANSSPRRPSAASRDKAHRRRSSTFGELTTGQAAARARLKAATPDRHKGLYKKSKSKRGSSSSGARR